MATATRLQTLRHVTGMVETAASPRVWIQLSRVVFRAITAKIPPRVRIRAQAAPSRHFQKDQVAGPVYQVSQNNDN